MIDLDLDGLVKKTKTVKLDGEIIEIQQPSLRGLVALLDCAKGLEGLQGSTDVEKITKHVAKFQTEFSNLIPQLGGKTLTIEQMLALLKLVIDLATPSTNTQEVVEAEVLPSEKKT
jgi:hypothetical protein